jgi:hypothetical protein
VSPEARSVGLGPRRWLALADPIRLPTKRQLRAALRRHR